MMKIKENKYIKSIATLVSGSMIVQIVTILCSPLMTRLFTPSSLGVYSLVTSVLTLFGAVMSLRYEICIVSEPDEKKVYSLVKLSFIICFIMSLIIFAGYTIYFKAINTEDNAAVLAAITAVLACLFGAVNILTAYNNRQKDYKLITKTYVQRVLSQNILNIASGFLGFGAIGLSASHTIGYMAGVRGQLKPLLKKKEEIRAVSSDEVKEVFDENINQAVLSSPATFANGLSYSLINYFIEALFTTEMVGYYSISYRILGLPITIVSANISKVFLERASSEYKEKNNFRSTFKTTFLISLVMGLLMGAALILFAPWACELFFGDGWGIAGVYIRILTPMYVLRFIAGGINNSAVIVQKQHIDLIIQLLLTATIVSAFIISKIYMFDIETFLEIINIGFCILYAVYIFLFWRCSCGKKVK